jgi:hypothetical protein
VKSRFARHRIKRRRLIMSEQLRSLGLPEDQVQKAQALHVNWQGLIRGIVAAVIEGLLASGMPHVTNQPQAQPQAQPQQPRKP